MEGIVASRSTPRHPPTDGALRDRFTPVNDHQLLPSAREVRAAASRLTGLVRRTPTKHSPGLSALCGGDVFLKLECLQESGSFKLRGAMHALLSLSDDQRAAGVVASSAGNHGLGVAVAAARLGVRATIFIPATAPSVKRSGIVAAGATVHATEPNYDAAEVAARAHARATGATFLSPCTGRPTPGRCRYRSSANSAAAIACLSS